MKVYFISMLFLILFLLVSCVSQGSKEKQGPKGKNILIDRN